MLREEFDDWAILFDPDTGRGFGLNPTGVSLWTLLDGEHTFDALLQNIRHDTDNVPEEAGDDIRAFVDDLVANGLAGFGSTAFGSAECSLLSPEKVSGAKPFPYECPRLIDFLVDRRALGLCQNGSGDSGGCTTGNAAHNNCYTGVAPGNACGTGNGGTPFNCANGATATINCGNGTNTNTICNTGGNR